MINLKIVNFYYGIVCNLSCKGCFSGSDIIKHRTYDPSLENILESVTNASKHISNIDMITLIGGEPLLYWDEKIVPVARHIRKCFPNNLINITTNGLLLHKFKDKVINLLLELGNCSLSITNHFTEFSDDKVAKTYHKNLEYFLSDPQLFKIHDGHYDIPDATVDIHIHNLSNGFAAQFLKIDGKLKPFATNNPAGSMKHGCTGRVCAGIIDSQLFKCDRLAVLPYILTETDQLTDPDWQKYLNYNAVDLRNPAEEALEHFKNTEGLPIPECDVCPDSQIIGISKIPRTKENVLP